MFQAKERVKICPDCGGGISVDARFCQHCGTDLVTPDSASFEVVVMQGQDDEEQAERASVAEEIHRGAEPAESVTGPGEKSVPPEEKAAPGQASPDNGSLRFVLESAEMPQDAEKALPEDQEEELEPAGEESPTEEPAQLREMEPGENQEITATREESAVEETGEAQAIEEPGLEKEEESGEGPEDQPEIIKCPFCGLDLSAEILECPNCGEKLLESEDEEPGEAEEIISLAEKPETGEDQGAAAAESPEDNGSEKDEEIEEASLVRNLLREVEELDLRKFILSESFIKDRRTPDLPDEELLVFPLRRFCGRCPVVRFTNGDQEESFTTRCGLVFTGSSIRFIFSDGLREISYRLLEKIDVEEFAKNDTALLCQLNLKTSTGGNYHIMLPFQASVARKLGETLRRYLVGKAHALADAAEEVRLNGKKEEREEDAS